MNKLEEIRQYHDNFKAESLSIRLDLFDPHAYLTVKTKYEKFLELMYHHFPYMIRSQFYAMYGKSKNTNIAAVNELINLKMVREVGIAGNNYILPISRMSQYFEQKKQPARFKVKPSLHTLFDHFMRAELFVKKGILVHTSPSAFFGEMDPTIVEEFKVVKPKKETLEKEIQILEQEIGPHYNGTEFNREKVKEVGMNGLVNLIQKEKKLVLLKRDLEEITPVYETLQQQTRQMMAQYEPLSVKLQDLELLAIDWKNKKGFNGKLWRVQKRLEQHEFLKQCLSIFPDRSCYFKNIIKSEESVHFDIVIVHYDDSTKKRYIDLIDDLSRICYCFTKGTFSLQILTESELEKGRATTILKEALNERLERKVREDYLQFMNKNFCTKYTVTNTNIVRYLTKHSIGETIIDDTDFSELEKVLENIG